MRRVSEKTPRAGSKSTSGASSLLPSDSTLTLARRVEPLSSRWRRDARAVHPRFNSYLVFNARIRERTMFAFRLSQRLKSWDSARLLREKGFEVGESCLRGGQLLVCVNNILMFPSEAEDLAQDRATLKQIIDRNAGNVFPSE